MMLMSVRCLEVGLLLAGPAGASIGKERNPWNMWKDSSEALDFPSAISKKAERRGA